MSTENDEIEKCPVCSWTHSDGSGWCSKCGRPSLDVFDTGLDGIPPQPNIEPNLDQGYFADDLRKTPASKEWLARAGYHAANVGASVTSVNSWKAIQSSVSDTPLFEYLAYYTILHSAKFWAKYHGYETLDELVEAGAEGIHSSSVKNIARSWRWIRSEEPPTTPEQVLSRQNPKVGTFSSGDVEVPSPEETSQSNIATFNS